MKKIVGLLLALILSFLLVAWCSTHKEQRDLTARDRFIIVESNSGVDTIYCDTVTGVLYWKHSYGLTVLVNEQGLPLIYDEG